ncbi:MAG: InlB B-repeat-containing protein, partial [Bryobacteraceae bacterium]
PGGLSIAGNNGGTNIPASPYPSRINVTNLAGAVQSVTVSLDTFSDAFPQNSRLLLVGQTSTDIVFWDNAGGSGGFSGSTFTIADSASGAIPETSTPSSGSYRPTAYVDNPQGVFPSPAPVSESLAAPVGSQTLTSAFQNVNPNGYWDLYLYDRGGDSAVSMGKYCLNFVETPPVLAIAETGPATTTQGQTGVQYTITVTNNGPGSTSGTITATPTASSGLTLTGLSSTDASWTCSATNCTRTAAPTGSTITATYTVTDTASSPQTASSSVSGGGSSGTVTSNTVTTTINAGSAMVSFSTSPSGLSYTVDSTGYTSAQTLTLNFGPHTIATTSPQTSNGTQNTFTNWSDSGAISHSITVGSSSSTSYTATFSTSYLLTTAANPADGGTVTPVSGTYYTPGTVVNLTAAANPGYAFSSWTGSVASANSASTTVTMNAPQTVTANFTSAGGTSLGGLIGIKSGPTNARVWPFIVGNQGPGAAAGARISSPTLQQTRGTACTPAIVTALPLALGDIAPKGSATGNVTIDFSSCQTGVMFKATVALSANSGAATG